MLAEHLGSKGFRVRSAKDGSGELGARVEVEGRDEVAFLAESFNHAAAKMERVVEAQKTPLAGASHEFRTPLTRIRVAAELLPDTVRPGLVRQKGGGLRRLLRRMLGPLRSG